MNQIVYYVISNLVQQKEIKTRGGRMNCKNNMHENLYVSICSNHLKLHSRSKLSYTFIIYNVIPKFFLR